MKRFTIYLLSLLVITAISCNKDDDDEPAELSPSKSMHVVVLEQTGTWCGACPNAADILHDLDGKYGSQIVPIAVHGANGDPMEIDCFNSFRSDRNSSSFPSFFITEDRTTTNLSSCESAIDQKLAEAVEAGIAIRKTVEGGVIKIETKTKFFTGMTGDYYLSVFVTEDAIDGGPDAGSHAQAGGGAGYTHEHVLRASATPGNFWGEKIATDPSANKEVSKTYNITAESGWQGSKLHVCAVLWKHNMTGDYTYTFVNAIGE